MKFSDLVTDTESDYQLTVSCYNEFAGEIVKISSVKDIERVIGRVQTTGRA